MDGYKQRNKSINYHGYVLVDSVILYIKQTKNDEKSRTSRGQLLLIIILR